jgi:hypothetical protein
MMQKKAALALKKHLRSVKNRAVAALENRRVNETESSDKELIMGLSSIQGGNNWVEIIN